MKAQRAKAGRQQRIDGARASVSVQQIAVVGLITRGLQWLQARRLRGPQGRRLQLCATVPLGEKRFVSIVECDGQQFLIGGGAGNVCLLAHLSSPQATKFPAFTTIAQEGPR
jgi:flagellar biogenesis protein FliO